MKLNISPEMMEQGKLMLENFLEKVVEKNADALADKGIDALKQVSPDWGDVMLDAARGKFKLHFKALLLAEIEKISPLDNPEGQ
jgi:hypothetical protein